MRKQILFSLLLIIVSSLFAQEQKHLTLEDLIPGGKTFYNYYPRIPAQYQWHGDTLVAIQNDSVFIIHPEDKTLSRNLLFSYKELPNVEKSVYGVSFPQKGNQLTFFTRDGMLLYNLSTKQKEAEFIYPKNGENYQLSPDKKHLAYTKENNLYIIDSSQTEIAISNEKNKDIRYGHVVHRNEFGINKGIFWSPDGQKLAFYRMDESMVTNYPLVDISTRIATLKNIKYPMAGTDSHHVTVGVFDTKTGQIVYLKTGEPKDKFLTNVAWSPDSKSIYIAELNREQNHMKLNRYDVQNGEREAMLFEEKCATYVEPQHPVLFVQHNPNQFIWQSRRDGYNHLYLYSTNGKLLKQLTRGNWEVTDVLGFNDKGNKLYFASTNPTPMDRHIYSIHLKSGQTTRYSKQQGMHYPLLSASGKYLIDKFSSHDNPGAVVLVNTSNGEQLSLTSAKNPFEGIKIPTVESGTLKAADNETDLYYRFIKPANFDPSKKYPVVIYVYGGPHSQMVNNRWRYGSGGWELYMAQKGYLVFVMDNRGTSYRGVDFEHVIHRRLGIEEAKDQMRGVEFLKSLPYVDAESLGIHGWSYGGFMTINMLLNYPDVFKAGVAGGPVIDWKFYEIMYGERYMDTPQENPEGYEVTSLLNKADRLKSRLLIIHGDEDPVVVLQHSLQFLKTSVKKGVHPDYFIYPGHEHNMMGHDRVHLHEHITRYFDDFCVSATCEKE